MLTVDKEGGVCMFKKVLAYAATSVVLLQALPAWAQLEEITVTARKREESILQVPVIQSVLTAKELEQTATNDLFAVATHVPGLQLGTGVNATGVQLSIRGIGTTALNQTIDQSTSLNLDGLSLTQGLAYSSGMFDVAQVEVLKGPQSLFYGKNSPAGVISLRSADPTDEKEIILRGGYETEGRQKTGDIIVSGPVAPVLKVRLAAHYSNMEGYFLNDAQVLPNLGSRDPTDRRFPDSEEFFLRGTALLTLGDDYTARLKINRTHYSENGTDTTLDVTYCPDGTGAVPPTGIPFIGGNNCKLDNHFQAPWGDPAAFPAAPHDAVPFENMDQTYGTIDQNYKITPELTLTSVTGLYNASMQSLHLASTTGRAAVIMGDYDFYNRQGSQELRLTSDFGKESPVNFMLGAYYQHNAIMNRLAVDDNTTLGLPPVLLAVRHFVFANATSGFGQVLWNITDQLELAGGARWTHEARSHEQDNLNAGQGPLGPTVLIDPRISSSNTSPEASLTYKPTDDFTVFGSFKQGYKSGSFNSSTFIGPTTKASFNDERAKGGEMRLLDRQLQLDLAGYHYRYANLQVGALELTQLPAGGGVTYNLRTINAASAQVDGADFDATFAPRAISGLTLFGAANYNRARYISFPNAPCGNGQTVAQGCNQLQSDSTGLYTAQNLSGRPLVNAPLWSGTVGADYDMPAGNDMRLTVGGDATFTSGYSTVLINMPGFMQSGYAKFGANATLKGRNDAWEVALIGKNLANKYIASWCSNSNLQNATILGGQISGGTVQGPAGGDEAACSVQRGREVWLRFTIRPLDFLNKE
jgi:iron complex outermembrane receptor protein